MPVDLRQRIGPSSQLFTDFALALLFSCSRDTPDKYLVICDEAETHRVHADKPTETAVEFVLSDDVHGGIRSSFDGVCQFMLQSGSSTRSLRHGVNIT